MDASSSNTTAAPNNGWIIVCDFDGTISCDDVTDGILERFARPGWQQLESAWQRGEIGSAVCMSGQIELLDVSHEELATYLATVAIDKYFPQFFAAATAAGIPLVIASDGLDMAITSVLRRHALPSLPIISNRLIARGARQWQLQMPFGSADCVVASGTCKCAAAERLRRGWRRVLLIGDGTSDFCVARQADYVLAKERLASHCSAAGIAHTKIDNFADALAFLPRLCAPHESTDTLFPRTQESAPHA